MDHTVIPLAGMLTSLLMIGAISYATAKVLRGPVGQALARRIGGKAAEPDQELVQELMALREHVDQMEQRLLEAEERIDFSERLLTRRSEGPVRTPS